MIVGSGQGDQGVAPLALLEALPVTKHEKQSLLSRFLSFLAFDGTGARIGVEISLCFIFYTVSQALFLTFGNAHEWTNIWAWFSACIAVALLDHALFLPPLFAFRRACGFDAAGNLQRALATLERVRPRSGHLICFPRWRYHWYRALFLCHAEAYRLAQYELEHARAAGASTEHYYLVRCEMLRGKKEWEAALQEVQSARLQCGDLPALALEEALTHFDEKTNYRATKQCFQRVVAMPDALLPIGLPTHMVARAFLQATRLWTGEAEEGLEALSREIGSLLSFATAVETLRPLLARLYYERGYYFASHYQPELARIDLGVGRALCTQPALQSYLYRLEEELAWRYPA